MLVLIFPSPSSSFPLHSFTDADLVGEVRCVMSAWSIRDVSMVPAMAVHGNASAIRIGVAYYAIKVSEPNTPGRLNITLMLSMV